MSIEEKALNPVVAQLITELKAAQKEQINARNWMFTLIVLVAVVFVFIGYTMISRFGQERQTAFSDHLANEVTALMPEVQEMVINAGERLVPAYQEALSKTFERDQEKYYAILAEEYLKLKQTADRTWPKMQEAIAQLVVDQETAAVNALKNHLTPEQLSRIALSYHDELTRKLEFYFEKSFGQEMVLAEGMIEKLNKIAESEKDLPPEDSQFVLGMFLELLGVEMQLNSEAAE